MTQGRRIAIAASFLAVVAVPVLAAIALGLHQLAFYGLLGAAFVPPAPDRGRERLEGHGGLTATSTSR